MTGKTVYILCPTDGSDLNPDLKQNRIGLYLSPNQLIHHYSKGIKKKNTIKCGLAPQRAGLSEAGFGLGYPLPKGDLEAKSLTLPPPAGFEPTTAGMRVKVS